MNCARALAAGAGTKVERERPRAVQTRIRFHHLQTSTNEQNDDPATTAYGDTQWAIATDNYNGREKLSIWQLSNLWRTEFADSVGVLGRVAVAEGAGMEPVVLTSTSGLLWQTGETENIMRGRKLCLGQEYSVA